MSSIMQMAAVISMIPIGYLSTLLIKNRNILTNLEIYF